MALSLPQEVLNKGRSGASDAAYSYLKLQEDEDHAHAVWEAQLRKWQSRRARATTKPKPPEKSFRASLRAFAKGTTYTHAATSKHLKSIRRIGMPALSTRGPDQPSYLEPFEDEAMEMVSAMLFLRTVSSNSGQTVGG